MTDKNLLELEPINISLLESLDLAIQATEEKAAIYNVAEKMITNGLPVTVEIRRDAWRRRQWLTVASRLKEIKGRIRE